MTSDTGLLDKLTVALFKEGEKDLAAYFGIGDNRGPYDGARFANLGTNSPNEITDDDVLATTLLSIKIAVYRNKEDGFTPDHILALRDRLDDLGSLLEALGPDRDLHTLPETDAVELLAWEPGSPAYELYQLVRYGLGCRSNPGRIATWKLLARKRPALLAIRDNVVAVDRLSYRGDPWYLPWWRTLDARPEIVDRLRALQQTLPSGERPPLLRVADVVLWCGDDC